ncbi:MAG: multifunctional 2-oxoglutarate metabolism enzyme, partial [Subtercola sp.]|nr:multifunctional 2-oxoglutarate metabolism enzyme [Subtercola sp.]
MSSQLTGTGTDDGSSGEFGANEWLVDELYEQYLVDKNSVDQSWWTILEHYRPSGSGDADGGQAAGGAAAGAGEPGDSSTGEAQIPDEIPVLDASTPAETPGAAAPAEAAASAPA